MSTLAQNSNQIRIGLERILIRIRVDWWQFSGKYHTSLRQNWSRTEVIFMCKCRTKLMQVGGGFSGPSQDGIGQNSIGFYARFGRVRAALNRKCGGITAVSKINLDGVQAERVRRMSGEIYGRTAAELRRSRGRIAVETKRNLMFYLKYKLLAFDNTITVQNSFFFPGAGG